MRRLENHSHSIVLPHRNALIFRCKYVLRTAKDRLSDPSKIRARDFRGEFRRSAICWVSATIGINRSIFWNSLIRLEPRIAGKTPSALAGGTPGAR
jgi:hypothetical protein